MKAKDFYKKEGYSELDKYDRKMPSYTYYDLIEFAEKYHDNCLENGCIDFLTYSNFISSFNDNITFGEIFDNWKKQKNENKLD